MTILRRDKLSTGLLVLQCAFLLISNKPMDTIQGFIFEKASIRGELVHLEKTYLDILNQRVWPPMVKQLIGEALVSCVLLAGSIKFEGQLSLQFQGDDRLSLLLVQCDNNFNLRAFAKYQKDLAVADYAEAFLQGKMALTINQYNTTQTYQSVVPIHATSMSENLMHYFAQSEQIATQVWLAIDENRAAGMLLQLTPGQDSQHREEFWEYALRIGETITQQELLDLENEVLLHRLYHETVLRVFQPRAIRFQCHCTLEKMKQVLQVIGEEELKELLAEQGKVEINCDFCNKHYAFDAVDITLLFRNPGHHSA